MSGMPHRHLKPLSELAARYDHGTRMKYRGGCRCFACRLASSEYNKELRRQSAQGLSNRVVSAELARQHLEVLSQLGLGKRAIAAASGVRFQTIADIRSGRKWRIRESTERALMRIDSAAIADGACVPGGPTTRLIDELRDAGFTLRSLAAKLGYKSARSIPFYRRKKITARNACRVERLNKLLMLDLDAALAPLKPSRRGVHSGSVVEVQRKEGVR